ncbi:MAG: glycosyltransferase family 39 protein [Leptolyngbya sp. DLM2.Bin27]|nr:MAG: glycosyltransferase family 39 protein [Leptolyngbya sp. DLM2.Bin27]
MKQNNFESFYASLDRRIDYYATSVFFLSLAIFFWRLGAGHLQDWDEAIYAEVSKNIIERNDWMTLFWGDSPWFHKPPLFMWSTAVLFKIFGISEFSARAASAIAGIGLVVTTYFLGKKIHSQQTGFLAALILLSSRQIIFSARFGTTDIMLTLFMMLSIYAYIKVQDDHKHWLIAMFSAFALAFMVKGVASVFVPITIGLLIFARQELAKILSSRHFWIGLLIAALLILPWHLIMLAQHGSSFLAEYIGYHIISRATQPLEGHEANHLFYVETLRYEFFPWFYLILPAFLMPFLVKGNSNYKKYSIDLILFSFIVLLGYTLSGTKLPWYIIPIYPPLAVLVASLLVFIIRAKRSKLVQYGTLSITSVLLLLGLYNVKHIYIQPSLPVVRILEISNLKSSNEPVNFYLVDEPTPRFYSKRPTNFIWSSTSLRDESLCGQEIILKTEDLADLELVKSAEIYGSNIYKIINLTCDQ